MNTEKLWAYKAIETRYIGPTNSKGSRIKATEYVFVFVNRDFKAEANAA